LTTSRKFDLKSGKSKEVGYKKEGLCCDVNEAGTIFPSQYIIISQPRQNRNSTTFEILWTQGKRESNSKGDVHHINLCGFLIPQSTSNNKVDNTLILSSLTRNKRSAIIVAALSALID